MDSTEMNSLQKLIYQILDVETSKDRVEMSRKILDACTNDEITFYDAFMLGCLMDKFKLDK